MSKANRWRRIAAGAAAALLLSGCGAAGTGTAGGDGAIDYWLWDSAQQPGYQKCADAFEAENPDLKIRITQLGWDDYWSKLTAGFIADQAPDVFTNHLSKYAQFVDLEVLLPLDELEPTRGVQSSDYQQGLGDLWLGQDGHRYGVPKDWDTVGFFYDKKITDAAGITSEQLDNMTWNPDDGGTFEKIVARLTVDTQGRRGDEPGFDKNNVAVYGLATDGAGGENYGQTQWGWATGAMGWAPTDKNPWGTRFRFDDPQLHRTIGWYFGLVDKGYMPAYETFGRTSGSYQQMAAGKAVLSQQGSWMIASYQALDDIELRVAPTPVGPLGKRSTPFNGLADSVTTFTNDPEGSAKWVAFLGGEQCQTIIGEAGVVFPARPAGTERSLQTRREAGLDVTAFTRHVEEGTTQLLPVTTNAADLKALTAPAFESVYLGKQDASSLTELNEQVNKLFEVAAD